MFSLHSRRGIWSTSACAIAATISLAACGGGSNSILPHAAGQGAAASQRSSSVTLARSATSNTWSAGVPTPTKRFGAGATVIGTKIYVVGGYDTLGAVGKNEIFDTATNKWSTVAPMPTKRWILNVAAVNGIVYAIGGDDGSSNTQLNAVEAYDPAHNTWSTKAPLPTAVSSASVSVDGGLIYVIGGYTNGTGRFNGVQVYDATTNVWLNVAKSNPDVGTIGTNIVAAGGLASTGKTTEDNEVYDPNSNSWATKKNMPAPNSGACAAGIGGSLYVAGGVKKAAALVGLNAYDLSTNSWTKLASMPFAVILPAAATVNGRLYCIGGSNNGVASHHDIFYNYVQIYQP
jgi:N-acetylneuraminic acid mutarotase